MCWYDIVFLSFGFSVSATTDTKTGEGFQWVAQGFVKLSLNEFRVAGGAVEASPDYLSVSAGNVATAEPAVSPVFDISQSSHLSFFLFRKIIISVRGECVKPTRRVLPVCYFSPESLIPSLVEGGIFLTSLVRVEDIHSTVVTTHNLVV